VSNNKLSEITPRERVLTALRHEQPDRVPVDFLTIPEIWQRLFDAIQPNVSAVGQSDYFDPAWEAVLRHFEVDCQVLSSDQFARFAPARSKMCKMKSRSVFAC